MREVSVRMLRFCLDLARTAAVDEAALTQGLPSLAAVDGKEPDWIDWDDFIELAERFERMAGGPDGVRRALREALPTAYAELRAFASVFVHPIPLFTFVMTRLMGTMYRHIAIEEIERIDENLVRWTQTIPEPYRASEAFHRTTISMVEVFPHHLDLPDARLEHMSMTARTAELLFTFPPSLTLRGAVSSATSVLAVQIEEAFAKIATMLRAGPVASNESGANGNTSVRLAPNANAEAGDWAARLALSPRQRDVFALLVVGRANREIASALRCSERNVEFHVGKIFRAARVSSRAALLIKVLGAHA